MLVVGTSGGGLGTPAAVCSRGGAVQPLARRVPVAPPLSAAANTLPVYRSLSVGVGDNEAALIRSRANERHVFTSLTSPHD